MIVPNEPDAVIELFFADDAARASAAIALMARDAFRNPRSLFPIALDASEDFTVVLALAGAAQSPPDQPMTWSA